MQVHWKKTKRAKKYREWFYGDRETPKPQKQQKQKKTRIEVLEERRQRWEDAKNIN